MAESTEKVILVPRHTTLVGGTFHTAPLRAADYDRAHLSVWRGVATGSSLTDFSVRLQESDDLDEWSNVGGAFSPAGGFEVAGERALPPGRGLRRVFRPRSCAGRCEVQAHGGIHAKMSRAVTISMVILWSAAGVCVTSCAGDSGPGRLVLPRVPRTSGMPYGPWIDVRVETEGGASIDGRAILSPAEVGPCVRALPYWMSDRGFLDGVFTMRMQQLSWASALEVLWSLDWMGPTACVVRDDRRMREGCLGVYVEDYEEWVRTKREDGYREDQIEPHGAVDVSGEVEPQDIPALAAAVDGLGWSRWSASGSERGSRTGAC
jgi:hypothetical protein